MTSVLKSLQVEYNRFAASKYYIPSITAFAIVFYATGADLLGIVLFAAVIGTALLFTDDARFAMPPLFMIALQLSFRHVTYGNMSYYTQPLSIACFSAAAAILLTSITTFVIKSIKTNKITFKNKPSRLFVSLSIMAASMLTAGLFHSPFDFSSLLYGFGEGAAFVLLYLFFAVLTDNSEQTRVYAAKSMVATMILICLEIATFYVFRFNRFGIMDSNWKSNMTLGWGISNTAGALIVMLIPSAYYLIYKNINVTFNYCVVFIAINAVYFTMSRAALLIGFPLVVALAIFCFVKNKTSRKKIGILTVLFITAEIAFVIIMILTDSVKTFTDFFIASSLSPSPDDATSGTILPDTRGRSRIWSDYFGFFKSAPVFGVGFYNAFRNAMNPNMTLFSGMAHNTLIQFTGSCGMVGLLAYLYHRFETVIVRVKNHSPEKILFSIGITALVLMSLFDVYFMSPYFIMFYDLILVICEKFDKKENENV